MCAERCWESSCTWHMWQHLQTEIKNSYLAKRTDQGSLKISVQYISGDLNCGQVHFIHLRGIRFLQAKWHLQGVIPPGVAWHLSDQGHGHRVPEPGLKELVGFWNMVRCWNMLHNLFSMSWKRQALHMQQKRTSAFQGIAKNESVMNKMVMNVKGLKHDYCAGMICGVYHLLSTVYACVDCASKLQTQWLSSKRGWFRSASCWYPFRPNEEAYGGGLRVLVQHRGRSGLSWATCVRLAGFVSGCRPSGNLLLRDLRGSAKCASEDNFLLLAISLYGLVDFEAFEA